MTVMQLFPLAVVIEPRHSLAETVAEALRDRGYEVVVAANHVGAAAQVIDRDHVHFLVAAVPAPGEDRTGAYLAVAREKNPGLAVVAMLSDPNEPVDDAPATAVKIVKPFSRSELEAAIDLALELASAPI